jgi:GAF domain-containing protein
VDAALAPGASVAGVARANGVNANLAFKWIRRSREGWRDRRSDAGKRVSMQSSSKGLENPTFVPVRLIEPDRAAAKLAPAEKESVSSQRRDRPRAARRGARSTTFMPRPGSAVAAPNLPEAFTKAIDGAPISPKAGSCGAAAYRREAVIVADITTDPLWADYKDMAAAHGLRAWRPAPILSHQGTVLGVLALYAKEAREPTPAETRLFDLATHIAGIAIERKRAECLIRARRL